MTKDTKTYIRLKIVQWATAYEDAHPGEDQTANTEALKAMHYIIDRHPETERDPWSVTRAWVKDTAQWMTGTPDASLESMTFLLEAILKKLGKKVEEG